jgi:hypothetical protein
MPEGPLLKNVTLEVPPKQKKLFERVLKIREKAFGALVVSKKYSAPSAQ